MFASRRPRTKPKLRNPQRAKQPDPSRPPRKRRPFFASRREISTTDRKAPRRIVRRGASSIPEARQAAQSRQLALLDLKDDRRPATERTAPASYKRMRLTRSAIAEGKTLCAADRAASGRQLRRPCSRCGALPPALTEELRRGCLSPVSGRRNYRVGVAKRGGLSAVRYLRFFSWYGFLHSFVCRL